MKSVRFTILPPLHHFAASGLYILKFFKIETFYNESYIHNYSECTYQIYRNYALFSDIFGSDRGTRVDKTDYSQAGKKKERPS